MPPRKSIPKDPGRPRAKSGLPAPVPGQPFSLIGTLRRCTRMLSVEDAAELLGVSKKSIYAQIEKGRIPVADLGFDVVRIDPKAWALMLEQMNPHLKPSAREYLAAA